MADTVIINWQTLNKKWFDWISKSANTSLNYRKSATSKYKTDVANDKIWYVVKWWWNWPLLWNRDYFVKKISDNEREAIDSDWNTIFIPDTFEFFNEDGYIDKFNNWNSIRARALDYWNAKDRTKIKPGADINTASSNNVYYYGRDLLNNLKQQDRERQGFVSPQTIASFQYPYIDSNWKRLRTAPIQVTRGAVVRRSLAPTLRRWVRKFIK